MSEHSSLQDVINEAIRERDEEPQDRADGGPRTIVDVVFNPPQPPSVEEVTGGAASRD